MAYEFKKLGEVEALAEVTENATVLAEVDGSIKRIPSAGLGGGGIKTAIIKSSDYDDALAGAAPMSSSITFECINMTFEEAYETMESGEPLATYVMYNMDGIALNEPFSTGFTPAAAFGVPCIVIFTQMDLTLYWTEDGLSTERPGGVS